MQDVVLLLEDREVVVVVVYAPRRLIDRHERTRFRVADRQRLRIGIQWRDDGGDFEFDILKRR